MADDHFTRLAAWIARKGFVWGPSPEIYNGVAGFYEYGPLGKLLKNRVENSIRTTFIRYGLWEVECPILSPGVVWEASGHKGGFSDPVIKDVKGNVFRADNLIEEKLGESVELDGKTIIIDGATDDDLLHIIKSKKLKSPNGIELIPEIKRHSLLVPTRVGLDTEVFLRGETATTTYLPFNRYVTFFRDKVPFGVFQIGKVFRNEISPRQHILRMREFTQAEGQLFIFKNQKDSYEPYELIKDNILPLRHFNVKKKSYDNLHLSVQEALSKKVFKNQAYAWTVHLAYELFINMGIPKERLRILQHEPDKRAFYADDAWDIEINLNSFGWTEVCGVHDRTDYDLTQHAKHSKQKLEASNDGKKEVPHVLEIAFGTDRPTFALMDLFWSHDVKKDQEVFTPPIIMAPIQVAFFSLVKKDKLPEVTEKLHQQALAKGLISVVDHSGSIGRRYARMDEVGTPYCITVDFQTLEDGTVTVRERDSTEQKRIKISDLFDSIGK